MRQPATPPLLWSRSFTWLYITILLALTWIIYTPGFSGGFLFDDFSNLSQLGHYGKIDDLESLWLYLPGNFSGPTGRPISMLSFLLDAQNWPADPEPFKRTNVSIHLLNGLVLYALIYQLTLALKHTVNTAAPVAILATALWLLHPFWVSTTLYIVQRMAQLSTLFVLLGLWFYIKTRLRHPPTITISMLAGTSLAIGLMGIFATLSKENGVLLPLLAIILEVTVLQAHNQSSWQSGSLWFKRWILLLLGLPTILLLGFLATKLPSLLYGEHGIREFTPAERLLTQGRILWDYFFHLIIPSPYTGGLFNDDIVISTSLFYPWYTIIAWAAWISTLYWAILNRTKYPAMALAILFFLVGHLLESSFIQLELYFEHRNYLPATLLGFPLALWWLTTPINRIIKHLSVCIVLLIFTITTGIRTNLWGQPFQQAINWANISPKSPRAQIYLAEQWRKTNNLVEAERLNAKAIMLAPMNTAVLGQRVGLHCQINQNANQSISKMVEALAKKNKVSNVDIHHISKMLDFLLEQSCGDSSKPKNTIAVIQAILDNNHNKGNKYIESMLLQRMGIALLQQQKTSEALEQFKHSTHLIPSPGMVLKNAALLATHEAYKEALEYLDTTDFHEMRQNRWDMTKTLNSNTTKSNYYQREKILLREKIAKDAVTDH